MTLGEVRRRSVAGYYDKPEHQSEFLGDVRQCFTTNGCGAAQSDLATRLAYQQGNDHGRTGVMDITEEILVLLRA